MGVLSSLFALPFDVYDTFVIEERHGFNRQTPRGFVLDRVKGLALTVALGGPVLAAILWIMERMGNGRLPMYLGDDTTDEDAFRAIKEKGISISIGGSPEADYFLKNQDEVNNFLQWLIERQQ